MVKKVTCEIDLCRENVVLILSHKKDPPETIMLAHLETKNKNVPRLIHERKIVFESFSCCMRVQESEDGLKAIKRPRSTFVAVTKKFVGIVARRLNMYATS